jgi:hypothetical protein
MGRLTYESGFDFRKEQEVYNFSTKQRLARGPATSVLVRTGTDARNWFDQHNEMMMPKQNEAGRRKAKYQRQELLLKL